MPGVLPMDVLYKVFDDRYNFSYRGEWSGAATYAPGDVVDYGTFTYRALIPSTGVVPVNGATWAMRTDMPSMDGVVELSAAASASAADAAVAAVAASASADDAAASASTTALIVADQQSTINAFGVRVGAVEVGQSSSMVAYATQAYLYADLAHPDKSAGLVTNDPTPANNGTYRKIGAPGVGLWEQSSFDRVALLENRAASLEDQTASALIPPLLLADKSNRFVAGNYFSNRNAGTFAGWATAVTYLGESFDAIKIYLQVDAPEVEVRLQVRRADFTTVVLTSVRKINGSGHHIFMLHSRLTAADLPDSAFYVSVEAVGHNDYLRSPNTTSTARIADTSVYPIKYTTVGSADGTGWVNGVGTASNVMALAFYDSAIDMESISSLDNRVASIEGIFGEDGSLTGYYINSLLYEHERGEAEMLGNAVYAQKVLGFYHGAFNTQLSFNEIEFYGSSDTVGAPVNLVLYSVSWNPATKPQSPAWAIAEAPLATVALDPAKLYAATAVANKQIVSLPGVATIPKGNYLVALLIATTSGNVRVARFTTNPYADRTALLFNSVSRDAGAMVRGDVGSGYAKCSVRLQMFNESRASRNEYDPAKSGLISTNVQDAIDEVAARTETKNLTITIPPDFYAVVGREVNIYNDNIVALDAADYRFDYSYASADGRQQNERWNLVPSAVRNEILTLNLYSKSGEVPIASASTTITAKNVTVGTGVNRKCLFIGDSTTEVGTYTQELLNLFGSDSMDITLIGTKGAGANLHEGIGGWTIANFYTSGGSPFVFAGTFNFTQYMSTNGFAGLDYVCIHLGINDLFNKTTDAEVVAAAVTMLTHLEGMITSIHTYNAGIKIGILVTIPPSATQDAFAANYQSGYTRWRNKRNIVVWGQQLITRFKDRKVSDGIYLVPVNCNLDTVNNMQVAAAVPINSRNATTVARQSNGVHPAASGYYQIADTIYAFLKCQEI